MNRPFPPATHRDDPATSHTAEREHTASGKRARHCDIVMALVRKYPGSTASELDVHAPFDLQEVRRRLTDLKDRDQVTMGPARVALRTKAEVTWLPCS